MIEYQIIKRMYPFAEYVKYLAGDDLSEDQIVTLFKEGKLKCTVHFRYPLDRRLAKQPYYITQYPSLLVCDLYVYVNKDKTDLYIQYDETSSLRRMLPPEKDPERDSPLIWWMCFFVVLFFFGVWLFHT